MSILDKSANTENNADVSLNSITSIDTLEKKEITSLEISDEKIILNEFLKKEEIFKIASSNPEGLYVMVGSFKTYENAIKQQNRNPTDFTCHIFEPNYENINRVGLFISETNTRKALNALKEIRNMNKDSWLLYNEQN